jgi:TM2 domain-containing membrane protein YozV
VSFNTSDSQQNGPSAAPNLFGVTWSKNYVSVPRPTTPKNTVLAYVLWFVFGLGTLGVHQFYLGNTKRGLIFLTLWILTFILSIVGIGFITGLALIVYWIYDAVVLHEEVQEVNNGTIRQSVL